MRIAILGDSSSAGLGDGRDVYPYQLFERLRRSCVVHIENWSSPGLVAADAAKLYDLRLAARRPDLVIVYLGNNDGARSPRKGRYRPLRNRLAEQWRRLTAPPRMPIEDRPWYTFVSEPVSSTAATAPDDFAANLRWIALQARRHGGRVVLVNPVANREFPSGLGSPNFPFYRFVSLDDRLGPELRSTDEASALLVRGIRHHAARRVDDAALCYEAVEAGAPYCYQIARNNLAVARYEAGDVDAAERTLVNLLRSGAYDEPVVLYNLGRVRGSRAELRQAYESDVTLYRIKEPYRLAIARLAEELSLDMIDLDRVVRQEHFVDYCHLTREGHGLVAAALTEVIAPTVPVRASEEPSTYCCEFPSPDFYFDSSSDLSAYYGIRDGGAPEAGAARAVRRAVKHPAVTESDLRAFPIRLAHELGSFPEFYVYRMMRAYGRALMAEGSGELPAAFEDLPVRRPDQYERLVFGAAPSDLGDERPDLSPGRRDRVLDRIEQALAQPDVYADRRDDRRKTILYWYTRESFRFGTQSRPSMLYNRVGLEELAEAVAVAWIIDRLSGRSGAADRIERSRRRVAALLAAHETLAARDAAGERVETGEYETTVRRAHDAALAMASG